MTALSPGELVVVVSPHSDDGVLSLGAAIASWARRGVHVEILTVLGLDPSSDAPAGGWDARAGFATEGEAAVRRREEDRRACAVLGATPAWLPFGSVDFERHGEDDDVWRAVVDRVGAARWALLPGHPLSHPDHAWLTRLLVERGLEPRVGLYAEQPYTARAGAPPALPGWLADVCGEAAFERVDVGLRDRCAKWRAIRSYASQLPLLAMRRSLRRGAHVLAFGPERVAWAGARDRPPD